MISMLINRRQALVVAVALGTLALAISPPSKPSAIAVVQDSSVEPDQVVKARLQTIVKDILSAWDKADVVCLGEGHGNKNDSDLRITLIQHPDFIRKVNVIIVEFADSMHQDVLDRLALDGEDIPREQLREVWKYTSGKELWELPIYEAFLRAVRKVNLTVPRNQRVRLIAGDNSTEQNRGGFIREAVSREILDKHLKALAIYGMGHCQCRAMGFPGELKSKYPGRIWSAFQFHSLKAARQLFGLGDEPKLIPITGTDREKVPAAGLFDFGRANDSATLGNITNAIVYYGNLKQGSLPAQPTAEQTIGREPR